MSVTDEIRQRLTTAFAPTRLEIRDDSERHRGHAGFQEGGESHFHILIEAPAFDGMSRLDRHRAVHTALGDLTTRVHALALKINP